MADRGIHIISTSTVKPEPPPPPPQSFSAANQTNEIQLTPFDIQFLSFQYAQRGLLFPNNPNPQSSILPNLKSSLSRSLSIFPPFAGRLAAVHHHDGTASFSLRCNSEGAVLVHAVADGVSSSDVLNAHQEVLDSLFSMNGAYGWEGVNSPLLVVQLTELSDGIFMGITFSHVVADGSSFWHFLNTWSQISRIGSKSSTESDHIPAPVIGHSFLDEMGIGIVPLIRFPFPFPSKSLINSEPLLQRVFHFSKEKIAQLKSKSNSELTLTSVTISSFQSILAHIWRAVIRNGRQLDEEEVVQCKLMVDYRHRLRPNLPPRFFGNVVMFAAATATAGELVREGIGYAALRLNETVARQTDGEARKWLREEKVGRIGEIGRRSVVVADSPRFDVYGNDFGWGKPVAVRAAGNYSDGKLTVFAGKEEGSVDVQVCLVKETMDRIGSDSEFMEFVC